MNANDYPETEHPALADIIDDEHLEKNRMNEQKPLKDIAQPDEFSETLLVFDQEKQMLQAVKDLDKNGKLKTVEPVKENNPDFIRLDKNGDFLSNFYSNFVVQLKDPTRFRVFKIPIPQNRFFGRDH